MPFRISPIVMTLKYRSSSGVVSIHSATLRAGRGLMSASVHEPSARLETLRSPAPGATREAWTLAAGVGRAERSPSELRLGCRAWPAERVPRQHPPPPDRAP